MLIAFIVILVVTSIIYATAGKKYRTYIEPVDKKAIPLKQLLPIGLFILETLKLKLSTGYDRSLMTMLGELYGTKDVRYHLTIHWANKLVTMDICLLFILFFGTRLSLNIGFAVFGILFVAVGFFLPDRDLKERVKKRRIAIQLDFPDFVNKLTLLINAGMTIPRAWEKTAADSNKDTPLYNELKTTVMDIRAGKPEHRAYEDFAKRCRTPEITRFISVILQNMRKGGAEIVPVLRVQANECWEMRKNTAKRLGEEASTKMLFPMMLMFLAILLIVATPAVLSLRGF